MGLKHGELGTSVSELAAELIAQQPLLDDDSVSDDELPKADDMESGTVRVLLPIAPVISSGSVELSPPGPAPTLWLNVMNVVGAELATVTLVLVVKVIAAVVT